jgi:hypothetical protein
MCLARLTLLVASLGVLAIGCAPEPASSVDAGIVLKESDLGSGSYCGDGLAGFEEDCDGDDLSGYTCLALERGDGVLRCGNDCTFDTSLCLGANVCGNGLPESGEACDDGDTRVTDCPYGETSCEVCSDECTLVDGRPHFCGDDVLDDLEQCDGDNTGAEACEVHGYSGGTLGCTDACRLDFANCEGSVCGNGRVDGDEECDDGSDNTNDCPYGQTSCEVCRTDCTWGTGETYYCGDGRIDAEFGERCDGDLIGDATCFEHGLGEGTPACEVLERDDGTRACLLDLSPCEGATSGRGGMHRGGGGSGCVLARSDRTPPGALALLTMILLGFRRRPGSRAR